MSSTEKKNKQDRTKMGLLSALMAYSFWGVMPIYFKIVDTVTSMEVFAHRVLWSVPFGFIIILIRRQWHEIKWAILNPDILKFLFFSALLISTNWYLFIVAVQTDEILQASLGYYINPLLYVLVGVTFLKERLRVLQSVAIFIAVIGVLILTLSTGKFPWIAISLALTFTAYGVIRKNVNIGAMPGLFLETIFILPFAVGYFYFLANNGALFFGNDYMLDFFLILAGPFTVFPLLFFALAAKRLKLTTIGMMQFLAPTMQFVVALIYGEALSQASFICFICIWIAIIVFVYDAIDEGSLASY
ncbi:MAG: EamA family transporter RarD [Pseudomonadota bacterium]|nr:EamA family transporter RarD [Pseudomonadota bacterium]